MDIETPVAVLRRYAPFSGRRVAIIGGADPEDLSELAREGDQLVTLASPAAPAPVRRVIELGGCGVIGWPLALPFADHSVGVICFFSTLGLFPAQDQLPILREARRVLQPGGHVGVFEPMVEGVHCAMSAVQSPPDGRRDHVHDAVREGWSAGLNAVADVYFDEVTLAEDGQAYLDRLTASGLCYPWVIEARAGDVISCFEKHAVPHEHTRMLRQSMRAYVMQRL